MKKEKIEYESVISKMFNGEILNSVQCLTCKNVSTIKETFQDLSLPIPNKDDDLLQTRQTKNYLKKLELNNKQYLNKKIKNLRRIKNEEIGGRKIRNGLTYKKLRINELNDSSNYKLQQLNQSTENN